MRAKFLRLQEFGSHFLADYSTKETNSDNHQWHVAHTYECKDRTVVQSDADSTDKHGKRIDKLANFLADSLADGLEILGNLRRK